MLVRQETTLREIANGGEAARQLLDRWGLDFCCDGERTLRQACARHGLDEVALKRALETLAPAKAHGWPHEGAVGALEEQMHLENKELLPRARDLEPVTHHVP